MSNTTSHIILLIQCVLESCIWILFSEKRFLFLVFVIGYYFQKKTMFVSCDCNWILFSEKKIFVSCVCNWIYNQIYSNVVSVLLDIYT